MTATEDDEVVGIHDDACHAARRRGVCFAGRRTCSTVRAGAADRRAHIACPGRSGAYPRPPPAPAGEGESWLPPSQSWQFWGICQMGPIEPKPTEAVTAAVTLSVAAGVPRRPPACPR